MHTIAEIIGKIRGPEAAQVLGAVIGVGIASSTLPPAALIWVPAGIIVVTTAWAVAKYQFNSCGRAQRAGLRSCLA
jgi:hypothetical protein